MRRAAEIACVAACAAALSCVAAPAASARSGRYVVTFRSGVDAAATTHRLVGTLAIRPSFRYDAAIGGFVRGRPAARRGARASDREVDFGGPDLPVRASGVAPVAAGETVPPGIRRVGAATLTQAHTAADAPVAVLDSGVDLKNADLNAVSGKNC